MYGIPCGTWTLLASLSKVPVLTGSWKLLCVYIKDRNFDSFTNWFTWHLTKWTGLLASRHLKRQQGFWETGPWSNCSGSESSPHSDILPLPPTPKSQLTHVFGEEVSRVINLAWINGKHISKSSSSVNTETTRGTQNWAKHIVGNLQMMKGR